MGAVMMLRRARRHGDHSAIVATAPAAPWRAFSRRTRDGEECVAAQAVAADEQDRRYCGAQRAAEDEPGPAPAVREREDRVAGGVGRYGLIAFCQSEVGVGSRTRRRSPTACRVAHTIAPQTEGETPTSIRKTAPARHARGGGEERELEDVVLAVLETAISTCWQHHRAYGREDAALAQSTGRRFGATNVERIIPVEYSPLITGNAENADRELGKMDGAARRRAASATRLLARSGAPAVGEDRREEQREPLPPTRRRRVATDRLRAERAELRPLRHGDPPLRHAAGASRRGRVEATPTSR